MHPEAQPSQLHFSRSFPLPIPILLARLGREELAWVAVGNGGELGGILLLAKNPS